MELGQNLSNSIDYSRKLFADLGRLLILIVLDIIPIVNLTVLGYISRIIKQSPTSDELPPLKDYLSLWIQGLKILVAMIIYMIVPLIFITPFFVVFLLSGVTFPLLMRVGWAVVISLLVVGILLLFFILIIMHMGIVNMVKKDSFGKAFAIGEVLAVIRRIGWGTYIFWTIVIFICGLIVSGIGSIPSIGWLISLVIGPIFGVFYSRSASLVYSEGALPVGAPPPPERPPPPPPTEGMRFCTFCGAELAREALYCQKCGKRQEAQ